MACQAQHRGLPTPDLGVNSAEGFPLLQYSNHPQGSLSFQGDKAALGKPTPAE